MSESTYKLLTKAWEDPDGSIHEGEWREFYLVKITKDKYEHCVNAGFEHLVNGDWLWVKYVGRVEDKQRYVFMHSIDKIVDSEGNVVKLSSVVI